MTEASATKAHSELSHHTPMMTGQCTDIQRKALQGAPLSESGKMLYCFKTRENMV